MTEEPMSVEPMTKETVTEETVTEETVTEETVTKPVKTAAPTKGDAWETPSDTPRDSTTDVSKSELLQVHCDLLIWSVLVCMCE